MPIRKDSLAEYLDNKGMVFRMGSNVPTPASFLAALLGTADLRESANPLPKHVKIKPPEVIFGREIRRAKEARESFVAVLTGNGSDVLEQMMAIGSAIVSKNHPNYSTEPIVEHIKEYFAQRSAAYRSTKPYVEQSKKRNVGEEHAFLSHGDVETRVIIRSLDTFLETHGSSGPWREVYVYSGPASRAPRNEAIYRPR